MEGCVAMMMCSKKTSALSASGVFDLMTLRLKLMMIMNLMRVNTVVFMVVYVITSNVPA